MSGHGRTLPQWNSNSKAENAARLRLLLFQMYLGRGMPLCAPNGSLADGVSRTAVCPAHHVRKVGSGVQVKARVAAAAAAQEIIRFVAGLFFNEGKAIHFRAFDMNRKIC